MVTEYVLEDSMEAYEDIHNTDGISALRNFAYSLTAPADAGACTD